MSAPRSLSAHAYPSIASYVTPWQHGVICELLRRNYTRTAIREALLWLERHGSPAGCPTIDPEDRAAVEEFLPADLQFHLAGDETCEASPADRRWLSASSGYGDEDGPDDLHMLTVGEFDYQAGGLPTDFDAEWPVADLSPLGGA